MGARAGRRLQVPAPRRGRRLAADGPDREDPQARDRPRRSWPRDLAAASTACRRRPAGRASARRARRRASGRPGIGGRGDRGLLALEPRLLRDAGARWASAVLDAARLRSAAARRVVGEMLDRGVRVSRGFRVACARGSRGRRRSRRGCPSSARARRTARTGGRPRRRAARGGSGRRTRARAPAGRRRSRPRSRGRRTWRRSRAAASS